MGKKEGSGRHRCLPPAAAAAATVLKAWLHKEDRCVLRISAVAVVQCAAPAVAAATPAATPAAARLLLIQSGAQQPACTQMQQQGRGSVARGGTAQERRCWRETTCAPYRRRHQLLLLLLLAGGRQQLLQAPQRHDAVRAVRTPASGARCCCWRYCCAWAAARVLLVLCSVLCVLHSIRGGLNCSSSSSNQQPYTWPACCLCFVAHAVSFWLEALVSGAQRGESGALREPGECVAGRVSKPRHELSFFARVQCDL